MKLIRAVHKSNITCRLLTAVLCLGMVILSAIPAFADITANESMRLSKTEGTVSVCNQNSKSLSPVSNMKLMDGYSIETDTASYAWLTLDDTKAVKLDEMSSTEISQSGKRLELRVNSGNVLVNVDKHLDSDETLNIRTSTMVVGIRGTSVIVRVIDDKHSQIQLLEGSTEIQTADPVTGQLKTAVLSSGQTADTYVYDADRSGDKVDIIIKKLTEENITPFAAVELAENRVMQDRLNANTDLNVNQIINDSASALKAEQKAVSTAVKNIEMQAAAQSSVNGQTQSTSQGTLNGQTVVSEVFAAQETAESNQSKSDDSNSPAIDTEEITLNMPVTLAELQAALNTYNKVNLTGSGTFVLNSGEELNVPSGKTFIVKAGTGFNVASGGDLWIRGHMEVADGMTSAGTVHNLSSNTLVTSFTNNGTFENSGRLDGNVTSTGTFINEANGTVTGDFTNSGILTINGGEFAGTVTLEKAGSVSSTAPGITMTGGSVNRLTLKDIGTSDDSVSLTGGDIKNVDALCTGSVPTFLTFDSINITDTLKIDMHSMRVNIKSDSSVGALDLQEITVLNLYEGAAVPLTYDQVMAFNQVINYHCEVNSAVKTIALAACPFWGFSHSDTDDKDYLCYKAVPHTLMWVINSSETKSEGNTVEYAVLNGSYATMTGTVSAYSSPLSMSDDTSTESGISDSFLTLYLNGRNFSMGGSWTMNKGLEIFDIIPGEQYLAANSVAEADSLPQFTLYQLSIGADSDINNAWVINNRSAVISVSDDSALTLNGCTYTSATSAEKLDLSPSAVLRFESSTWDPLANDTLDSGKDNSQPFRSYSESGTIETVESEISGTFRIPSQYTLIIDEDSTADRINVTENADLESCGTISNLTNAGTANINISENGKPGIVEGSVTNSGTLNVNGTLEGTVSNTGDLTVEVSGTAGDITNVSSGSVTVNDGGIAGIITNSSSGTVTINDGGKFEYIIDPANAKVTIKIKRTTYTYQPAVTAKIYVDDDGIIHVDPYSSTQSIAVLRSVQEPAQEKESSAATEETADQVVSEGSKDTAETIDEAIKEADEADKTTGEATDETSSGGKTEETSASGQDKPVSEQSVKSAAGETSMTVASDAESSGTASSGNAPGDSGEGSAGNSDVEKTGSDVEKTGNTEGENK